MEKSSTQQSVTPLSFIAEHIGTPVSAEDSMDSLGLESLELLDLQLECEKHFGKVLEPARYNEMQTVGDLANAFC